VAGRVSEQRGGFGVALPILTIFLCLFFRLTIAPRRRTTPPRLPVTRLQARKMAEQAKAEEALAARIAELEEQVRITTERAAQAEKERDEATTEFPPGFDPTQMMRPSSSAIAGSSVPQSFPGSRGQWKWVDSFVVPITTNPVVDIGGETTTALQRSLVNLTLDPGKSQIHQEPQGFHPPQGHPTQVAIPDPMGSRPPFVNPTQTPFTAEPPPHLGPNTVSTEGPTMDRLSLLEERLRTIEGTDPFDPTGPADMCMVPGIIIPRKYKIPDFEKYTGVECPKTHLKAYCNKMADMIHNEPLLIHLFRESLAKHALTWYMGLDRVKVKTWRDLSDAFFKQYKFNMEVAPDRSDLQNLEKKMDESVKTYAQRWRGLASRISPPLNDKELLSIFINTFKAPYYTYLISNSSNSFSDMVLVAERVEQGIKLGRITASTPEETLKGAPIIREDVIFVSPGPSNRQPFPSPPPQIPQKNEHTHWNKEPLLPLPVPLEEIYEHLLAAGQIAPILIQPIRPPYPKWYDPIARCTYHAGTQGHTLENCSALRGKVNHLIKSKHISFEGSNMTINPIPNHALDSERMI